MTRKQRFIKPDLAATEREFIAMRPAGGFPVLYADPAYGFENWSTAGERKNPNQHYPCMTVADIASLPVHLLAADNAVLFLWATWPLMERWPEIYRAWGFKYSGLAWEWIKFNAETGKYAFGPGYGTRKNLEPCIICTKGDPQMRAGQIEFFGDVIDNDGVHSVRDFIEAWPLDAIRQPRREHSRKPEEARHRIETMFAGPYVELFARTKAKGWHAWGNQTARFTPSDERVAA